MTTPEKKPPQSTDGNGSQLQDFAREIGSTKGTDPIPPDQYLTYQDKRYPPAIRLWAWMLGHTIRHGRRKAWAIDENGRELHLSHAASDLDMDDGNIRRAWRQLEMENRVRRDGRKLRILGNVKLPKLRVFRVPEPDDLSPDTEDVKDPPDVGVNKKRSEVCTDLSKPYILLKLNTLDKRIRKSVETRYLAEDLAEKKCIAEATAAVRGIFIRRKDSILLAVGITVLREVKPAEAEAPDPNQLRFVFEKAIAHLVPQLVAGSVQTGLAQTPSPSVPGLHRDAKDVVQTPPAKTPPYIQRQRREIEENPLSSSAVSLPPEKAEEEDSRRLYQILKAEYPADHFDEPKTKPSFEKKTKPEQTRVIERLRIYLDCARWKEDGGRWIPFSSKWLDSFEADPPPPLKKTPKTLASGAGAAEESFVERQYREEMEKRKAPRG